MCLHRTHKPVVSSLCLTLTSNIPMPHAKWWKPIAVTGEATNPALYRRDLLLHHCFPYKMAWHVCVALPSVTECSQTKVSTILGEPLEKINSPQTPHTTQKPKENGVPCQPPFWSGPQPIPCPNLRAQKTTPPYRQPPPQKKKRDNVGAWPDWEIDSGEPLTLTPARGGPDNTPLVRELGGKSGHLDFFPNSQSTLPGTTVLPPNQTIAALSLRIMKTLVWLRSCWTEWAIGGLGVGDWGSWRVLEVAREWGEVGVGGCLPVWG